MNRLREFLNKYEKLWVPVFFLVITLIYTWPKGLQLGTHLTDTGDTFFVAWVITSILENLGSGNFSEILTGNIFYPYPNTLAFSDHSLTLALQSLPFYAFTRDPIVIINITQILALWLSGVFGYALARFYVKDKFACLVAGLLIAFSPYHFARLNHLQIGSFQYIPLMVLGLERLIAKANTKNAALFSFAFLANAFVSVYLLSYGLILLFIVALVRIIQKRKKFFSKKLFFYAGISIAFCSVMLLVLYLPYLEINKLFNTAPSIEEANIHSARFRDYLVAPTANWLLGARSVEYRALNPGSWPERTIYMGLITPIIGALAVFSIYFIKKKPRIKFSPSYTQVIYILTAIIATILAAGGVITVAGREITMPFYYLHKYIPIFTALRVPARVHIITVVAIAILAAIVIHRLRTTQLIQKTYANILLVAFCLIIFIEMATFPLISRPAQESNSEVFIWMQTNLADDTPAAHYPFYKDVEYLKGFRFDSRRTVNGYSGFFPESTRRMMDTSMMQGFISNPKENIEVLATMDVGYFVVHTNLSHDIVTPEVIAQIAKDVESIEGIEKLTEVNGSIVFDISNLKNPALYSSATTDEIVLGAGGFTYTKSNEGSQAWVSEGLRKAEFEIAYLKDDEIVATDKVQIYQTLFLLEGHSFETFIKYPRRLFVNHDSIKVTLSE